jgi:hypothetical protein
MDRADRERLVEGARTRLKARLRRVLTTPDMHVGATGQYLLAKTKIIKEAVDGEAEVRGQAAAAPEEMMGCGVRARVMEGFSPRLAEAAARNNLALRLRAPDEELVTTRARIQGVARQRLARRLVELEEDG